MSCKIIVSNVTKIYYQSLRDTFKEKSLEDKTLLPGDKRILDDISLTFMPGETIGIIGRNGAGKSTLLSLLSDIVEPTSGSIDIQGKVTAVMTLGIGLREEMSGRENIYLDGELQGKSRKEMEPLLPEIIAFAELDDFIDRPIKTYSTGMKSRLAFSMLVCIEPEILIIDEALSAGDVFFAVKASEKIREICQKGKIVIIVSHSMETIKTMCNRCLWLEKGKIFKDGLPEAVTQQYLQTIRNEDNSLYLSKNPPEIQQKMSDAAYVLSALNLKLSNSDYQQAVFESSSSIVVEIGLLQQHSGEANLQFFIERSDGIRISDENYRLTNSSQHGEFIIEYRLDSLLLNNGYYQIAVQLTEAGSLTAKAVRPFEVKNNFTSKGGVPMINYQAEICLKN